MKSEKGKNEARERGYYRSWTMDTKIYKKQSSKLCGDIVLRIEIYVGD
jgi:hypothetical protein